MFVFLQVTAFVQLTVYSVVPDFDMMHNRGSSAQATLDVYTHVVAKQVALMSKASVHSVISFNDWKRIYEMITQKGRIS